MFDVAIIGAGVNGTAMAHELSQHYKNIALFDKDGIAQGGSGAAGAFVSPKFSKEGELKELLHEAFLYSIDFYEKNFPKHLNKSQLIHIAKDEKDAKNLRAYKKNTSLKLLNVDDEKLKEITQEARTQERVSLEAGLVDASAMCHALAKDARLIKEDVQTVFFDNGLWTINDTYNAKILILATGAYKSIVDEAYLKIRGIWGHRIDIKTSTQNNATLHQFVSISTTQEGQLSIGATHDVHFHPQTTQEPYNIEQGRKELLEKASKTLHLKDVEILKDYTGLRSGSSDYMPLIGKVVLSSQSMQLPRRDLEMKKMDFEALSYYPNLYMINGSSGYGFVLAPFLAKSLSALIVDGKKVSERLIPARYFSRWAKKNL